MKIEQANESNLKWQDMKKVISQMPFSAQTMFAFEFSKYNVPVFKENPNKEYIMNGEDNLYCNFLVDCMNKSSTHKSLIDDRVQQIAGEGVFVEDSQDTAQKQRIEEFLEKCDANNMVKKLAYDQQVLGYFYIQTIWSNDRTQIAKLEHVDATTVRVGKPIENIETTILSNGEQIETKYYEIEKYFYSDDWKKFRQERFQPNEIAIFDTGNRISPVQLLMVKKYTPGIKFYSLPPYGGGALNYVELEYQMSNMMLNSAKNGLSPSLLIDIIEQNITEENRNVLYETFNSMYKGTDNAGKFILTFSKSAQERPSITPIETTNMQEVWKTMADQARDNIITAHRLPSPLLAGIAIPGSLGTSSELAQAHEIFSVKVIGPEQKEIEDALNMLLAVNGFTIKVFIKDLKPISEQYSDDIILQSLTTDEIRKRMGYTVLSLEDSKEIAARNGWQLPTDTNTTGKVSGTPTPKIEDKTKETETVTTKTSVDTPGMVPYVNETDDKLKKKPSWFHALNEMFHNINK